MQDLAHTLRTRLADRPRFTAPKRPPHAFAVDHYAGQVVYSTTALMDKNKDFTVAEQQQLMISSDNPFIRSGSRQVVCSKFAVLQPLIVSIGLPTCMKQEVKQIIRDPIEECICMVS